MKFKIKLLLIITFIFYQTSYGQQSERPKLIVGIVIDQMRAEYLYRFQDNYSEKGFKRLMNDGFNVKNTHYNYIPTVTGPGHASIFTGTTPDNHGVVGNYWFSKKLKRQVYCAEDFESNLVDNSNAEKTQESKAFFRSPKNLLTTTITDELKLFTNHRAKVIGISLKDRGAIFPSGHLADYAFWYNSKNGNFITSTYYSKTLPDWLVDFNKQRLADSLLNLNWRTMLPKEAYKNSGLDDAPFEKIFKGKEKSTFPYDLEKLRKVNGNFALLTEVPFGNTILTELAIAAIKGEKLGKGKESDFLTISYSSTDYIGHHFGIRSKELEDTYVRMDREIAILLEELDNHIGKGNYLLFLTADHAASDTPIFLDSIRLPGEFYNPTFIKEELNKHLSLEFVMANYISYIDKAQIYFNETKTPKELVIKKAITFLKKVDGIKEVFAPEFPQFNTSNNFISTLFKNGYHSKNSGDLILHFNSGWMANRDYGTTHGNAYNSDTHVPLLWYGRNIPKGQSIKRYNITQIAPTLSMLLDIPLPNASNTNPIEELFK